MLDAPSSAFNGDIGNARTGPFSMQYRIACDATPNRVTRPDGFDMVTLVHWFPRGLSPERFTQD